MKILYQISALTLTLSLTPQLMAEVVPLRHIAARILTLSEPLSGDQLKDRALLLQKYPVSSDREQLLVRLMELSGKTDTGILVRVTDLVEERRILFRVSQQIESCEHYLVVVFVHDGKALVSITLYEGRMAQKDSS